MLCDGVAMMHWVIDLDGVMWRGAHPIVGSVDAITTLVGRGERVLFCTNNSTESGAAHAAQLSDQGIPSQVEVVTSADAVSTLTDPGERILVLGSAGLAGVLTEHGCHVVRAVDAVSATGDGAHGSDGFDAVVTGLARDFDYMQLDLVAEVVRGGARLLATNADPTFPAAGRVQPGAGSVLAAVEAACGVSATVAGKPEAPMARLITGRLGPGPRSGVVVGDRPDSDGRLAQRLGLPFALVLSGVTERRPGKLDLPVAAVAQNLASLISGDLLAGDPSEWTAWPV